MNKHGNKPNKWNEEQRRKAEQKYCWKLTAVFASYDEENDIYDGGLLKMKLFDTIDDAMICVEKCVTYNHEEVDDLLSNIYLWKERPSWALDQVRINTVGTDTGSVVRKTAYIIDRVERNKLDKK